MTIRRRQLARKFFADRGTHLAAMVPYFAILSFVPLIFLALSLFGLAHRAQASTIEVLGYDGAIGRDDVDARACFFQ